MFVLGLDGGGTKTEVLAADVDGRPLASVTVGGTSLSHHTPAAVKAQLAAAAEAIGLRSEQCAACCAGFASAGSEANRQLYEDMLPRLWPNARLRVVSDLDIAWEAAGGGTDCIVVIAGTGSAALGRYRGRSARAGGLGPRVGDEGSADWIGRQLQAPAPPAAALPGIVAAAAKGDMAAADALERAGRELAQLAAKVAAELAWNDPTVVAMGGVFRHAAIAAAAFEHYLREMLPRARRQAALESPAHAALRLAHADAA